MGFKDYHAGGGQLLLKDWELAPMEEAERGLSPFWWLDLEELLDGKVRGGSKKD
jgi:hypothetical protein